MANTGMRHGTEALNLKWKHVTLFEERDLQYLEMSVTGKTGRRDIICRSGTINYLKRIHERCDDIKHIPFEDLLKQRVDLPVFRLPDGTVSKNIHQTFRKFVTDTGLIRCPRTNQNRTLYSLRHTYATFALLNDGNSAMNRVFDEAVARGFIAHKSVPLMVNRGEKSERRPDFTREEYATLIRKLPSWINAGKAGKPTDMRHLMRDYVLVLSNTGMRHGTEALNLKWKHVTLFEEKDLQYLEMSVTGKTGRRDIICRSGTIKYLKRIHERSNDIKHIPFEDLLKQRIDLPVFRLPDGTVSKNIHQTFRKFVTDAGLITCPRTNQNRTLYSLRHTYATFALLNDGMDIHALAIQMGTSIGMIERHYSHLTPRLKKDMLTGKRYELSKDEWEETDGKGS